MGNKLAKMIILGVLLLFVPITFLWRRQRQSGGYRWVDVPGENIPLPEEVCGQRGSEVCVSPDGQIIVVAGNRVIPQDIFEGKREPALVLFTHKYFIYASKTHGRSFERVYRSPSPGVVTSMALSVANPSRLAYIAAEFQTTVPETEDEMYRMSRDARRREQLAEEYATALQVRDLRVGVYVLDTDRNEQPRMLCTLDNYPLELEGDSGHVTRLNDGRLYAPWELRLRREKEMKSIAWTSNGNALLVSDGLSLTKIDLNGRKTSFYSPGNFLVSSNIHCCENGEVLLLEANLRGERHYHLTRLDRDGNVVSKASVSRFYRGSLGFDEAMLTLVGEDKMAIIYNRPENMHDAFLRTVSFPPYTDDWRDRADVQDFRDPNRVQFYYLAKAFLNRGDEVLLFKRRALAWTPMEGMNWEVTPWTVENAAAPWVELRKMKIG